MTQILNEIVTLLRTKNKTVATMESCTGGGLANAITNIPGASEIIRFSAVTYANEFKIKMGVPANVIDTYTVYSMETARAMSQQIALFADADFGIGVTGQLRRTDPANPVGSNDCVYYSIWTRATNTYTTGQLSVNKETRSENKDIVINTIAKQFTNILQSIH